MFSQKIIIYGTVTADYNEKVIGASVLCNGELVTTTDEKGFYEISSDSKDSILVTIKSIGFKTQSKIFSISESNIYYKLDFHLDNDPKLLKEIIIEGKTISLFEKTNWTIYDYFIDNDLIFVIASEIPKKYIYIFNLEGKQLAKKNILSNYISLNKSCLGGYQIISSDFCTEFNYINDSINLGSNYPIRQFENYIVPCVFKHDSILIFKTYKNFNKRLEFYYYDKNKNRKIIYELNDKENFFYAKREFFDIIKLYHKTINKINNDKDNIKIVDNIIELNEWNGDIDELGISDDLMFKIMWFKSISLKKIDGDIFELNGDLYIIDFVNKEILNIDESGYKKKNTFFELQKVKTPKIINDNSYDKSYFKEDIDKLYEISVINDSIRVDRIYFPDLKYSFPKKFIIYNNDLFFLNYDNVLSTYNKLIKYQLGQ